MIWRKCTEDVGDYRYFGTGSWGDGNFITNERHYRCSTVFEVNKLTIQSALFAQNVETNKWLYGRFSNTNTFWL